MKRAYKIHRQDIDEHVRLKPKNRVSIQYRNNITQMRTIALNSNCIELFVIDHRLVGTNDLLQSQIALEAVDLFFSLGVYYISDQGH